MKKFLGYVLIHPSKQDFVVGLQSEKDYQAVLYLPTPDLAARFKDFKEIEDFVLQLEDFDFDIANLFDSGDQYVVEFETTVSSKPN